jgi:hypothetical protein
VSPSSGSKISQARNEREAVRKQGGGDIRRVFGCRYHLSGLAYSSALNVEATCNSETSAGFKQTTRY